MKLNGKTVTLDGVYAADPFLTEEWPNIVKDVQEKFPGIDLISFQCPHYVGLASISESLDPMKMAMDGMARGVMVMGSNKKVNIMTQSQLNEVIALFDLEAQ